MSARQLQCRKSRFYARRKQGMVNHAAGENNAELIKTKLKNSAPVGVCSQRENWGQTPSNCGTLYKFTLKMHCFNLAFNTM